MIEKNNKKRVKKYSIEFVYIVYDLLYILYFFTLFVISIIEIQATVLRISMTIKKTVTPVRHFYILFFRHY